MKSRFLMIAGIITATTFVFSLFLFDQAYASCMSEKEIDWDIVMSESEMVFTGTIVRLDNYDGPQKVTFFIHDVFKGEINTPKHVLENSQLIFHENGNITNSSVNVDYKIGKTYKVYVTNGETNQCTTKIITSPAGYVWEPGPDDGNYYSDGHGERLRQYQDANERQSYQDALESGFIVLPIDFPELTDGELDNSMDNIFSHGLDHIELPIASIAIDYERDVLILWTPDLTFGNKIKNLVDDVSFVLLYEEAPVRWTHDGPPPLMPEPEPQQDESIGKKCGPGTILQDGMCVANSKNKSSDPKVKWVAPYENAPSPNLESIGNYNDELSYIGILIITIIAAGIVFSIWKKNILLFFSN